MPATVATNIAQNNLRQNSYNPPQKPCRYDQQGNYKEPWPTNQDQTVGEGGRGKKDRVRKWKGRKWERKMKGRERKRERERESLLK